MTQNRALSIENWIKTMGFRLTKSHSLDNRKKKIRYYTLGNFGVYEEITPSKSTSGQKKKFISWTPWGVDIEVNSVTDLWCAYEEFEMYNPNFVTN
ncbi:hypothetical protein B0I27_102165 [Arcticibacter pallidicorallinus]|uniref:Uncharacterized protein n=1 Tax=Arcticibacter pallidicorallinus TaxID=1259464 RepID=A0A2T0U900_9SPHI|nr:hypothetical protein [Arcticibacter pallidicorallinus]PRY54399.1 hypothetical protein B0I27_102165 [Arcticibacter pallidicorallinus]